MIIDYTRTSPKEIYQTMIQTIVPRPVAWVLSENQNKSLNLAPFSYFTGVCSNPAIISISAGYKRDGSVKDTCKNIDENRFFCVHIATCSQAYDVTNSAKELVYNKSEVDLLGLETTKFNDFYRLSDCPIAMLCKKHKIIQIGKVKQNLIFGEVLQVYINDDILNQENKVDQSKLDPLARLGDISYGHINQPFRVTPS